MPSAQAPQVWAPHSGARHPALIAAVFVSAGVLLGDAGDFDSSSLIAFTLILAASGVALARLSAPSWRLVGNITIALALVGLGSWRIAVENSGRPSPSLRELTSSGRRAELFARVDGVPFQKSSGWRVPLELISIKGQTGDLPADGRVLLTSIPSLQGLRHGDYVRFEGRVFSPTVQRNPGGFDYAEYLHRQGFDATIHPDSPLMHWPQGRTWSLHNLVEPARQWIRSTFAQHLEETPRSLLVGLLLGDTDRLPRSIYDAFRESGTSHLLAVSGANVWLVVGMILWPLYYFSVPRWPRTLIALVVIILFSFLTRNEPSVVRASLMVGLILAGQLLWRPAAPLNAVGAAALVIMLFAPSHLFRPGFQLSFAAVIGILVAVGRISPRLHGFWRRKWVYAAVMFVVASVAATIATAPISAWHFGTVPVAGIVSNLLMVPLAGLTAHLGLLILAFRIFSTTLAGLIAWPVGHLLGVSTQIAEFFAAVPSAVISWPEPSPIALIHIVGAVILLLSWRHRYRWFRPVVYYVASALIVLAVIRLRTDSTPPASLSFLDTGRQRVAVVAASNHSVIGLVDDPGIDDDLDQWVVRPFLRRQFGEPSLGGWEPWRRLTTPPESLHDQESSDHVWRRVCSEQDSDSLGRPRVWADHWSWSNSDVLMFRDAPEQPVQDFLSALDRPLRDPILVLPAQARQSWIREAIDATNPATVVLYGRSRLSRPPVEILDFWRLRYPEIEFYSSGVHGGVIVSLQADTIAVWPTVKELFLPGG